MTQTHTQTIGAKDLRPGVQRGCWTLEHQRPVGDMWWARCEAGHARWVATSDLHKPQPRCAECGEQLRRQSLGGVRGWQWRRAVTSAALAGVSLETYLGWLRRAPEGVSPAAVPVLDWICAAGRWVSTTEAIEATQRSDTVVMIRLRELLAAGLVETRTEHARPRRKMWRATERRTA